MNDYNDLIPALLNPQCPLKFMLDNLVTVHGYAFVKEVHPSKNFILGAFGCSLGEALIFFYIES